MLMHDDRKAEILLDVEKVVSSLASESIVVSTDQDEQALRLQFIRALQCFQIQVISRVRHAAPSGDRRVLAAVSKMRWKEEVSL